MSDCNIPLQLLDMTGSYLLRAYVPGAQREWISLTLRGKTLTLSLAPADEPQLIPVRSLIDKLAPPHGSRSIVVPQEPEADKVEVRLVDGVLLISLPKQQQTQRVISVKPR